jgi:hypothetical protein
MSVFDIGPLPFDEAERLALQHPRAPRRVDQVTRSGAGQIMALGQARPWAIELWPIAVS